jgi:hypothetical protein
MTRAGSGLAGFFLSTWIFLILAKIKLANVKKTCFYYKKLEIYTFGALTAC